MLVSYASYFVAYLLHRIKNTENIERISLYGSVARNESKRESDIDIFIEVKKKTKKFKKEIEIIEKSFYQSREAAIFKTEGVTQLFAIKIGKIGEWKDLYRSIASTGILLYSPYEAKELPQGVTHAVIIFWGYIGKNRGAFLNTLYGYTVKKKKYPGFLERYGGKKIGKSSILVPIHYKKDVFAILQKYRVEAKTIEIFY